jgi:hypothetical protein
MWPRLIVTLEPRIQVGLQFIDGSVDLLAESDTVELIEYGLMETHCHTVRRRAFGLCAAMVNVLHGQVQFVLVALRIAAILGALICEHSQQRDLMRVEEGRGPIIE